MTQPRHVEFKSSVCSLCGGTHYGSTECPYRCERCTTNTDPCHLPDCPRNARWAAENAAADARIAADRGKPLAREQIEHHLRECRMNTQPKHTLPRDRLMALCEAALRSLPTEEATYTGDGRRVVCAAIRNSTGDIICAPRHFDMTMRRQVAASQFVGWSTAEQGFVDQRGEWLTREEARRIALANGQVIRRCGGDDNELFSENLY